MKRGGSGKFGIPIKQPQNITIVQWSKESGNVRHFGSGNFRNHDFNGPSNLTTSGSLSVAPFACEGGYRCLFCRLDDYPDSTPEWPEVSGRATAIFPTATLLDRHILAYHLPFVKGWMCPAHPDYVTLTREAMVRHIQEPLMLHRSFADYPVPGSTSNDNLATAAFAEGFLPLADALESKANPLLRVPHLPAGIGIKQADKRDVLRIGPYLLSVRNLRQREKVATSHALKAVKLVKIRDGVDYVSLEAQVRALVPCASIPSSDGVVFGCHHQVWASIFHLQPVESVSPAIAQREMPALEELLPVSPAGEENMDTSSSSAASQLSPYGIRFPPPPGPLVGLPTLSPIGRTSSPYGQSPAAPRDSATSTPRDSESGETRYSLLTSGASGPVSSTGSPVTPTGPLHSPRFRVGPKSPLPFTTPGCGRGVSVKPALTPPRPGKTRRVEEDHPPSSVSTVEQVDPTEAPAVTASAPVASGDEETPQFVEQDLSVCPRDGCRIDRTLAVGATAMSPGLPAHPLGNPGSCFPQSPSTVTELPHDSVSAGVLGAGNYEQERRFLCRFREQLETRTLPGMRQPFQQLLRTM